MFSGGVRRFLKRYSYAPPPECRYGSGGREKRILMEFLFFPRLFEDHFLASSRKGGIDRPTPSPR